MIRKKFIFVDEDGIEYECRRVKSRTISTFTKGLEEGVKKAIAAVWQGSLIEERPMISEFELPIGNNAFLVYVSNRYFLMKYHGGGEYEVKFIKESFKGAFFSYKNDGKYTLFWFIDNDNNIISDYYCVEW